MLEDLGNLGDFIGGIAVVATLLYLAVQVRQNTLQLRESSKLARIQARDASFRSFSDFRAKIVCHADVADLYAQGLRDSGALRDADRLRFHLLASELFYILSTSVYRLSELHGEPAPQAIDELGIDSILRSPGMQAWWRQNRAEFRPDFVDLIDSYVAARSSGSP